MITSAPELVRFVTVAGVTKFDDGEGGWVTINGTPVLIEPGQSVKDAVEKKWGDKGGKDAEKSSAIDRIDKAIAADKNASPETKATLRRDVASIKNYLSEKSQARLNDNLEKIHVHQNGEEIERALGFKKVEGREIGGAWSGSFSSNKGELHINMGGGASREVLAHEITHGIDHHGSGWTSDKPGWRDAWGSEIETGKLSEYAKTSPREGFAEFGRLYMSTPKVAKRDFPKAFAFWQEEGL